MTEDSANATHLECDWCSKPAEYNKDIYYACGEHESDLTELVEL